jgi:hypothetical protein
MKVATLIIGSTFIAASIASFYAPHYVQCPPAYAAEGTAAIRSAVSGKLNELVNFSNSVAEIFEMS